MSGKFWMLWIFTFFLKIKEADTIPLEFYPVSAFEETFIGWEVPSKEVCIPAFCAIRKVIKMGNFVLKIGGHSGQDLSHLSPNWEKSKS